MIVKMDDDYRAEMQRKIDYEIPRLRDEIKRLREALRRLEWVDHYSIRGIMEGYCPACNRLKDIGHTTDCWLAALLEGKS